MLFPKDQPIDKFLSIENVRDYLDKSIQDLDLEVQNPPFTSQLYHPLRKKIFQNYLPLDNASTHQERNQIMYELIQVVDEEYLNMFHMLLSKPYQDLISKRNYGIPKDIDVEQAQKNTSTLNALSQCVASIAEWNIMIERLMDQIHRSEYYKIWIPQKRLFDGQINAELKSLLSPNSDFSYKSFTRHVLANSLAYGANKVGKFLYASSLSESNLTLGAGLLAYHLLIGTPSLPWNMLIRQLNLRWLVGGMAGSLALGQVSTFLNSYDATEQIMGCAQFFKETTLNLVEFNEKITEIVNSCFLTLDEDEQTLKRKELAQILDAFIEKPDIVKTGINQFLKELQDEEWELVEKVQN